MNAPAANRVRAVVAWALALAGLIFLALIAGKPARKASATETPQAGGITLTVNATQELGPISPLIYGLASPGAEHLKQLHPGLARWGGNPSTRYNWEKGNCWNAARDWEFRNGNYGATSQEDRKPSGAADRGIAAVRAAGAEMLLTIPTMGWVARDDNNATRSLDVPRGSGPPVAPGSEAIAGYDPTQNRQRVSVRSLPHKGKPFADPPDLTDNVVYQDEWVSHLTRKFGKASTGGVRFYAMDNEPDLWDSTHTDMHPVAPDYDEILQRFLDYATAVKDVDPSAQVTGPVSWGWTGYFFSPRDRGNDNFATHADRQAHGDLPLIAWFLQKVAEHDRKIGRRTLDVLDVHFYPQGGGVYSNQSDPQTDSLRLRSTRALWASDYKDESWINTQIQLIPRLRQWVAKYYPGTKIGLTEWNWGADNTLPGGLAVAEVLGILGRERVDIACYWMAPAVATPGFFAYKMYRNADDRGHGFGDRAIAATSTDEDRVSCFGSVDAKTGETVVMLLNKQPRDSASVTLNLIARSPLRHAQGFRYSGANLKAIETLPDITLTNGRAQMTLPAYSLTLLRCK